MQYFVQFDDLNRRQFTIGLKVKTHRVAHRFFIGEKIRFFKNNIALSPISKFNQCRAIKEQCFHSMTTS